MKARRASWPRRSRGAATGSGRSDWAAIAGLYDRLLELTRSPVIAVNRARFLQRRLTKLRGKVGS